MSEPELKTNFNILWIKENINNIINKINEMKSKGKTDPFDFEMSVLELYPEFYESHPFLVKTLCKREDLSILNKMLDQLTSVESGTKSFAGVELKLGEELANQYLYHVINKKNNK